MSVRTLICCEDSLLIRLMNFHAAAARHGRNGNCHQTHTAPSSTNYIALCGTASEWLAVRSGCVRTDMLPYLHTLRQSLWTGITSSLSGSDARATAQLNERKNLDVEINTADIQWHVHLSP